MDGTIALAVQDHVAVVTIDRPSRRNALNGPLWHELAARVEEAAAARPRALVVTGAGGHFCAGMDLAPDNPLAPRMAEALLQGNRDAARGIIDELLGLLAHLRTFPAPVIAAIEGSAIGGGLEIALHCDVRIAAADAKLGLTEVRLGLLPDLGGCVLLPRLVGPGRAAQIIAGARTFSGEQGAAWGVVEQVVPSGTAFAAAQDLARTIAGNGPRSVMAALRVIRAERDREIEAALHFETEAGVDALTSGEAAEGIAAFLQKRAPAWPAS